MATANCPICCETYNASTRSNIVCENGGCEFECCKTCVRTYLLGTTRDPHCMNCRNAWSQRFLVDKLNRSFVTKDYKIHRQNALLETEISKLPETMDAADRTMRSEHAIKEAKRCADAVKHLQTRIRRLKDEEYLHRNGARRILSGKDEKKEKRKFIMACPGEDCRGFLSSQYKCELCKLQTCSKCFEIIGHTKTEEHTCIEANVQSADLIRKETKPCPACGTRISKINGCDQMWCVNCHQAFSWKTGELDNGVVHNPHFYQFERAANNGEIPRQAGDILCGGLIAYGVLNRAILKKLRDYEGEDTQEAPGARRPHVARLGETLNNLRALHRTISHIAAVNLPNTRTKVRELTDNKSLRVDYILKGISKEDFATQVYRRDNQRRKTTELLNVYELINVVGIELFTTLTNDTSTGQVYYDFVTEQLANFDNLRVYCNEQFMEISKTYHQMVPQISKEWYLRSKKYNVGPKKNINTCGAVAIENAV
jgi:hypothetical protein